MDKVIKRIHDNADEEHLSDDDEDSFVGSDDEDGEDF